MAKPKTILPTTKRVRKLCNLLDQLIERLITKRRLMRIGRFESEVEAFLLMNLAIRHVEGVLALARYDLIALPSAIHLARAAFEVGVRAAWLVDDDNPYRREARWLAHLEGEISYLERSALRLQEVGLTTMSKNEWLDAIREFREAVAPLLSQRGIDSVRVPKFDRMLESIGGRALYGLYMEASQYAQGGHAATWTYRGSGLGAAKSLHENVDVRKWFLPLQLCWLGMAHPAAIVFSRSSGSDHTDWVSDLHEQFSTALQDLILGPV